MIICAVVLLSTWLSHYFSSALTFLPVMGWLGMGAAALCLGQAYLCNLDSPEPRLAWPWSLRIFTLAHFTATLVLPLLRIEPDGILASPWISNIGLSLLITSVFGHLNFLRRRGHHLHWSMIAVVLLWLVIGIVAISHTFRANLSFTRHDFMERTQAIADLLEHSDHISSGAEDSAKNEHLRLSLINICAETEAITRAFVIREDSDGAKFLAEGTNPRIPHPETTVSPVELLALLQSSNFGRPIELIISAEDGQKVWVALAGILSADSEILGAIGLMVPQPILVSTVGHSVLVTEIIIFTIAMVIFIGLGAYLNGRLRVTQRDDLIDISSTVSQDLMRERHPQDIAPWLIEALHEKLDLVYASFWVCGTREGEPGFRDLVTASSQAIPSQWHDMALLNPVWQESLCNNKPLIGSLQDIGEPIPNLIPNAEPDFWVRAQNIPFRDQPWGAIITVFANRSHGTNRELGKTLNSLASAMSLALLREERGETLAIAEERLNTIVETSQDGFWDADLEKDTYYRSRRWWKMLGYDEADRSNEELTMNNLIHEQDLERIEADFTKVGPLGRNHRRRSFKIRHRDGRWRWIESNMVEIRSTEGPVQRAIGFDRDVTERMGYEMRLKEAADAAKRANSAKSEFLATVSHELRTPLNSIMGFTDMLRESSLEVDQRDFVDSVRSSSEQLLALISDLLDISRIEAGRIKLEFSTFELLRICEQAMEHFRHQANKKRIGLHLNFDSKSVPSWVSGDALRLRQILTNLVGNAVKFTQTGHVVLNAIRGDAQEWKFVITDTGPGIPAAETDRLFNRFEQFDTSSTRSFGGTGLGLAISRELARAMSGEISVQSEVGVGSSFTVQIRLPQEIGPARRTTDQPKCSGCKIFVFDGSDADVEELTSIVSELGCSIENIPLADTLSDRLLAVDGLVTLFVPRAFDSKRRDAITQLREDLGDQISQVSIVAIQSLRRSQNQPSVFDLELDVPLKRREVIGYLCGGNPTSREIETNSGVSSVSIPENQDIKPSILVAEDNDMNRKLMGFMMIQLGFEIEFAEDGEIAIEMLQNNRYDLALIDIQMPQVDGFGVAKWVKNEWHGRWSPPPLIALTAFAVEGTRQKCLSAGMSDFITKPISLQQLSAIILQYLKPDSTDGSDRYLELDEFPATLPTDSVPPTPVHSAGVDWRCFDSVCDLSGARTDPTVLRNLLEQYKLESVQTLTQVSAVAISDPDRARRLLHKLKGSTGSLGFLEASELIKEIHNEEFDFTAEDLDGRVERLLGSITMALEGVFDRYPYLRGDQQT